MSITEPTDQELFAPQEEEQEEDESYYLGEEDALVKAPTRLSLEESIKLRLEFAKQAKELEELRKAAEKSKPAAKESWLPSEEDFQAHADKLGYAIGAMLWGLNRAEKENKTLAKIANALGESLDQEVVNSAIRASIGGYRRAYKQFRFPSIAITKNGHRDDELFGPMAYNETILAFPDHILELLRKAQEESNAPLNPWLP